MFAVNVYVASLFCIAHMVVNRRGIACLLRELPMHPPQKLLNIRKLIMIGTPRNGIHEFQEPGIQEGMEE